MTHMCFNVQTGIIVECVSQFEVDGCGGHSPAKEEESPDAHAPDRETIHQSSLMPDTRQRPDEEREPREYGGDDKCRSEPTGILMDCRYCVDFCLDEYDCVGR